MSEIIVRNLGLQSYEPIWHAMQEFTNTRGPDTDDEIWFCEHEPVFTLGLNSAPEHLLATGDIPVVQIDRGGQVTYHGPGQLMIYPLIDIRRASIGVRDLVTALEQCVVDLAAEYGIEAASRIYCRNCAPARMRCFCPISAAPPSKPVKPWVTASCRT